MSNNAIGASLRTTLGLDATGQPSVTSYNGSFLPAPLNGITDGTDGADDITMRQTVEKYVFGMGGDDTLRFPSSGGAGILVGGTGADTFVMGNENQSQGIGVLLGSVIDFSTAEGDKVDLSAVASSINDVTINQTSAASASIVLANGDSYVISGLDVSLTEANLIFGNGSVGGGSSSNTDTGTTGSDTADTLPGSDALADLIIGLAGDDLLYGLGGNDTLNGNTGADTVYGNAGDDDVYGGKGDDITRGGQGNDTVNGNIGNDSVFGDVGDDLIHGGKDNDTIEGGTGNDTIYGDLGNDTLTGGEGADTFVFASNSGNDTITDFVDGTDSLQFSSDVFASESAAVAAQTLNGSDVVFDLGNSNTLTIENVGGLLDADDLSII